jgi:hypothetical protein
MFIIIIYDNLCKKLFLNGFGGGYRYLLPCRVTFYQKIRDDSKSQKMGAFRSAYPIGVIADIGFIFIPLFIDILSNLSKNPTQFKKLEIFKKFDTIKKIQQQGGSQRCELSARNHKDVKSIGVL